MYILCKCSNASRVANFNSSRVYGIQNDADEIISHVALQHIKFCKIREEVCVDFLFLLFNIGSDVGRLQCNVHTVEYTYLCRLSKYTCRPLCLKRTFIGWRRRLICHVWLMTVIDVFIPFSCNIELHVYFSLIIPIRAEEYPRIW